MTKRQKHKSMKRPRSWHRRGNGPDRAFARAMRRMERALARAARRPPEAAETFTHPTTPTAADKAAKPSAHTQKEQL